MNYRTGLLTILHRFLVMVAFLAAFGSPTATANPFFVMDPGVRTLPGSMEQRYRLIQELGYAGVSINDASLNGIDHSTSTATANGMKVFAVYLPARLTSTSLLLPPHFEGICQRLGKHGGLVWLYVDGKAFKPSDSSADSIALPALKHAAEVAARYGVRIALYPHRDYWIESFADALRVAETIDQPNLGVSFNLAHSLYAGEEAELPSLLERAGKRLFMVSINGADSGAAGAGWDRLIQPLGHGSYDALALRAHLGKLNYTGPVGLQTFAIKLDPVETLRISMDAWKRNSPEPLR